MRPPATTYSRTRRPEGTLPDFDSVGSNPGSPPPALELEVTHRERATQTSPDSYIRPGYAGPEPSSSGDVLHTDPRPRVHVRPDYPSTPQAPTFGGLHSDVQASDKQHDILDADVPSSTTRDTGTDMPPMPTTTTGCQAGTFFDNELIPHGAPCPKLAWAYTYAQFDELLAEYPEVHPENFVKFTIL